MVRLERRRVKKRLASVQFDAATNHNGNIAGILNRYQNE